MARTLNGNLTGAAAHGVDELTVYVVSPREQALNEIHQIMGEDFQDWYEQVYLLRREGRADEYEQAIFNHLAFLQSLNEECTCSPDDHQPICGPCKARTATQEIPY